MSTARDPRQVLREAQQIARDHGLFVVEKPGKFLLYRKCDPQNVLLGTRSSVPGIRSYVCRVAGFS